jgi:hypothetical protein
MHLQYYIQKKSARGPKNTKDVACEGLENNTIVAVFEDETEFYNPHFSDVEMGK